ncbi:hypothetical protein GIB67_039620 [Kingdonia uniflora]|uniref:Saccharopine dehydrogenase NADP binding domain-containing protein n=1 Tax=Kingdonia uniflora TaxID=39325 RepID=A0A7J7MDD9_9MAGN|nr:hypothetical protein GIB67_039620 [Kingdonia uniflora]
MEVSEAKEANNKRSSDNGESEGSCTSEEDSEDEGLDEEVAMVKKFKITLDRLQRELQAAPLNPELIRMEEEAEAEAVIGWLLKLSLKAYIFLFAIVDVDLVVHAAGPFQQTEKCSVLEAAIATKTAYVDVCDDTSYSRQAKSFHKKAVAANIPAITTAGIYPGVSNVMAAELVRSARGENVGEPDRLRFSYYTAGSGGAGPTILATSFLLLGEEVVAYSKGEKIHLKPYSGMLNIDFGKRIGKKDVYLL